MRKLAEYVGDQIMLKPAIPFRQGETNHMYLVTLRGVETGGLWIECETLTQEFVQNLQQLAPGLDASMIKPPIYFWPYAQIAYLVGFGESGKPEVWEDFRAKALSQVH